MILLLEEATDVYFSLHSSVYSHLQQWGFSHSEEGPEEL